MSGAHEHPAGPTWLWLAAIPLVLFLLLAWGLVRQPLPWQFDAAWIPSLSVSLAFRIDGLSALMLALVTGIGTWVFVYASGYLAHEPRRGRLFAVLLLFMLAMVGAVSADNVIVLFLFWELTSLTSFLLVGFQHRRSHARSAARQALLITMGGGLALLGGLTLLAQITGSWTLSGIVAAAPAHLADARLPYALLLVLLGAFTKSAQFPFHFWLPNAMSAPTPVSAYLHSATMVKLGIYLMARLDAAFNDLLLWEATLVATGTVTAVWAGVLALRERDLKRILARSTVSALGTLTLLVGLPNPGAGLAVVTFLFAHALYKAPLFMVAGNIDHATGTRIIDHLMGLRRAMPWTAAVAVLAGLSMAGLPLSFGFVAKDVMSAAKAEAEVLALVSYATVFVNAISVAVAGVAAVRVFWGPPETARGPVHEVSWRMLLPPLAIVLLGMEFDFVPTADPLLLAAARVIAPGLGAADLSASYGLDVLLSATGLTVLVGLAFFLSWDRLHQRLQAMHWLDRYGPAATYELLLRGLALLAARQTRLLQHGRLTGYLRLALAALLGMGAFAWMNSDTRLSLSWTWPPQAWAWLVAGVLIVAGAGAALRLRDRLAVLMASGLVGYGSAALFLFAGAPDLAFTQFAVETVLVVVAASVLPHYGTGQARAVPWHAGDLLLAAAAGLGTFLLLAHLDGLPPDTRLADWFGANSLPAAHGRNVVNVIIVDFRALDTLGEIAVVAFSLLAALPLLAGLKRGTPT
ncbi:MAG: hydrogen gas-evolving membrane-bound hydrogenase subunit E [Burkholderiales bacterium]